jgi:hypothetical protein
MSPASLIEVEGIHQAIARIPPVIVDVAGEAGRRVAEAAKKAKWAFTKGVSEAPNLL